MMLPIQLLIYGNVTIFSGLALLHIYWALGGIWGIKAAIPELPTGEKAFQPRKLLTLAVGLVLFVFAFINLSLLVVINIAPDHKLAKWLLIFISMIFCIRAIGDFKFTGFLKKHKLSKFAKRDTFYYSPLCLLLSLSHMGLFMILQTA